MKVSKILCISVILIQFVIIVVFITNKNASSEKTFEDTTETIKRNVDTLSFMLETSYGSGQYEKGTSTKWPSPSDGYIFNATLSKCQNGGELGWDDTNNVVTMTGNMSDKCYVYFDAVQKAVINEITTSDITTTSMTVTINATKGTFDISKYYYSIDNGSTWNESTSNVIAISGLTKGTEYTIKTYVQDAKGINSEYKSVSASTLSVISFVINGTTYYAEPEMTWIEWLNSTYSDNFPNKSLITISSFTSCPSYYINSKYVTTDEMCKNVLISNAYYSKYETTATEYIYLYPYTYSADGSIGGNCLMDSTSGRAVPIIGNSTIQSTIAIINDNYNLSSDNYSINLGCSIPYMSS